MRAYASGSRGDASRVAVVASWFVLALGACSSPSGGNNSLVLQGTEDVGVDTTPTRPDSSIIRLDETSVDDASIVEETGGCSVASCGAAEGGTTCGNGKLEEGETCDDGNSRGGDGCSGACRLEPNYRCPLPGQACESTLRCGDSIIAGTESCDDGNTIAGDGCDASCAVEPGWSCATAGQACVKSTNGNATCGNAAVEFPETCDDGNAVAGDGCSDQCVRDEGWSCGAPGEACHRDLYCGDGQVSTGEECDDGNVRAGDGCTGLCRIETFFVCPTPGQPCQTTIVCGDGKVVGDEACDDGNTTAGDGCSTDCKSVEGGHTCPSTGGACTVVWAPQCGDGRLSAGEQCDDGNLEGSDGCSSDCRVQPGYTCGDPGTRCTLIAKCGDGRLDLGRGEECDDGNDTNGDGCNALCKMERDFSCPEPGAPCVSTVKCGDRKVTGTETCDDGNARDGDGCSASCAIEPGWKCESVGARCREVCGDGKVVGNEQCDDGGATTPGCSATCQLELGYVCASTDAASGAPQTCKATTCGDGIKEGTEQCDGTGDAVVAQDPPRPGDGCSISCSLEPTCRDASGYLPSCVSACGDGLKLPNEDCDDGNKLSGDGCSSTCKKEPGFSCVDEAPDLGPTLEIPVILRDFKIEHPDFENANQTDPGAVETRLDAEGLPVLAKDGTPTITSKASFAQWYRDVPNVNKTFVDKLVLTRSDPSQPYQFENTAWFPLSKKGWGNEGNSQNFHFTSVIRYWFQYRGGEVLDFTGDDDVWVFVNGTLAVDIGGVHGARRGSVELKDGNGQVCDLISACTARRTVTLGLVPGQIYEIVLFQAERHTSKSNYKLSLAGFNAPRTKCTSICGDGKVVGNEACDDKADNGKGYGFCTAGCELGPRCGDNVLQSPQEACDDGTNLTRYSRTGAGCAPGCTKPSFCGDGKVDGTFGEVCDDGADNGKGYGFCTADCQAGPRCGDGIVDGSFGEQCDDKELNGTSGSACNASCKLRCGDGIVDPGEECDQGASANTGGYGKCQSNCILGPRCGDGIKNGSEQCDFGVVGNTGGYNGCTAECLLGPYCGDGTADPGEACDLGAQNSATAYGKTQCTSRCQAAPYCGDGRVLGGNERCDDGVNSGQPGSCTTDCRDYVLLVSCGNGRLDSGEECDDGSQNGKPLARCDARCNLTCGNGVRDEGEACDYGTLGNTGAYGGCTAQCTLGHYCGDGVKDPEEQCDRGSLNEDAPYGPNKCTKSCTIAPYCGDGRVQGTEQCDGTFDCDASCKRVLILR